MRNGYPKPNITWYRDQNPLQNTPRGGYTHTHTHQHTHINTHVHTDICTHTHTHNHSDSHRFLSSVCVCVRPEVKIVTQNTVESSGLVTVHSELQLQVKKSDKDASFYCEVSYFVPGGTRMTESTLINITVHCEYRGGLTLLYAGGTEG